MQRNKQQRDQVDLVLLPHVTLGALAVLVLVHLRLTGTESGLE